METTGCGTAIVTPFRADGSIDESALWALVNWQIDAGIDFIVACGSTHRHRGCRRARSGVGGLHA
jgi:4-hydroxy-tetrahydrodipicolinate synthase